MESDVSVTEFKGNATDLIRKIDDIKTHTKELDKSLSTVLAHLQEIENSFQSVNKNTTHNSFGDVFNLPKAKHSAKGKNGFMSSDTGTEQVFQDYQAAIVAETKAVTADITRRKNLRKKELELQEARIKNEADRLSKKENENSSAYQRRQDKLAEAKLLNAQARAGYDRPRNQIGNGVINLGNTVSSWGTGGKLLGYAFDTLGQIIKNPVTGAIAGVNNLVKAVGDLGKASIQAYSEIESIKTQLGVVFSSQTQADNVFSEISQYAVKSPFGVQQTSELAVLLKQSGVYASDLMSTLRMLGDTAGGNMEKMKRIANNYAQIMSIGKASMLDMRQFAYAGIPIFEAVSKELGVSQQELRKLISDGKVTSDIITKVFKDLTGINGLFENATEKGAKTLKARLQNLQDARQLMFASFGEYAVNTGVKVGNDSVINNAVSGVEKIYDHLKNFVNTKNIERDVQTITNRNSRIEYLKELIDYNKDNKDVRKWLEKELDELLKLRDPEKERATYEASYQSKQGRYEKALEALNGFALNNLNERAKFLKDNSRQMTSAEDSLYHSQQLSKFINFAGIKYWNPLGWKGGLASLLLEHTGNMDKEAITETLIKHGYGEMDAGSLQQASEAYNELVEAIKAFQKLTEEDLQAHREWTLQQAQSLAYDSINSRAGQRDSLMTSFQELTAIYRDSDEYKEKQEAERKKRLEEALTELKKIAKNTNEKGVVDITKFTAQELNSYFEKGAFTAGRKLSITGERLTEEEKKVNKEMLQAQYGYIAGLISREYTPEKMKGMGLGNTKNEFSDTIMSSLWAKNSKDFYKEFPKVYEKQTKLLEDSLKIGTLSPEQRNLIVMLQGLLDKTLNVIETDTSGQYADLSADGKKKTGTRYDFIPLWKRIIAGKTGLSANVIDSTMGSLNDYKNDLAIRNNAAGVLSATLKSMGPSIAMSLIQSSGNAKKLRGDTTATQQVDWTSVKENLRAFSLSLSASTEVINAYKSGLEQQLAVYQDLLVAGYTEGESQDIQNRKTISEKEAQKLITDAGDQLVNAFGEVLIDTQTGQKIYYDTDKQKYYDSADKDTRKEVDLAGKTFYLTGNLFEFLKQQIPEILKELKDANASEVRNQIMNETLKEILPSMLLSIGVNNESDVANKASALAIANAEKYVSLINSEIKALKQGTALEGKSEEDIYATALTNIGSEEYKIVQQAAAEALRELAQLFIHNDTFSSLQKLGYEAQKQSELTSLLTEAARRIELLSPGTRGTIPDNTTGPASKKDDAGRLSQRWYDLYQSAGLEPDRFTRKEMLAKGAKEGLVGNADKYNQEGLTDDDIVKMLKSAEKATISWAASLEKVEQTMDSLNAKILSATAELSKGAWLAPFETWGECLLTGADTTEELKAQMKGLAADMLKTVGPAMAEAGFSLVTLGAKRGNWGLILGGLALAAAGGFASGLGSALESASEDNDDESEKVESLKDQLAKLLEQARTDALYYENNLRHKTALGINKEFTYRTVNDAIITPSGNIVSTHPQDYLIATKQPQNLIGGGNVTVSPIINCSVINNTNSSVRQEQQQNADGSIDIVTIIEEVAGNYIASSKSDDAFSSRDYRLKGTQAIM